MAVDHALDKLEALGEHLPFPHQSAVRGSDRGIRELRPRSGRSATRGFYARRSDEFVLLAIGPEAQADQQGFDRAVRAAEDRLAGIENETKEKEK